ncbi:MAG: hypothetical protein J6B80_07740 [Clostridia bacterium]|nr:hypothetical protein [Clostridia bacterium]
MKKLFKVIADFVNLISECIELFTNFSMMRFRSAPAHHSRFLTDGFDV